MFAVVLFFSPLFLERILLGIRMECVSVEFYTHVSYLGGKIVAFSVGCVRSSLVTSLFSPNFSDVVCDMFAVGFFASTFCSQVIGI